MSKVSLTKVLVGLLIACLRQSSFPHKPYLGFRSPRTFVPSKVSLTKVLVGLLIACLRQSSSPHKPYLGFRGPRTFVPSKVSLAKVLNSKKNGMSYDIPFSFLQLYFLVGNFKILFNMRHQYHRLFSRIFFYFLLNDFTVFIIKSGEGFIKKKYIRIK